MKCHGHTFEASAETYVGTQVWPFAVHILHNCTHVKANGETCGSTRAWVLWEEFDETELAAE